MYYANIVDDIRIDAFNADGTCVWSSGTLPPQNDTIPLENWTRISFDAGDHIITRLVVTGGANLAGIDNFEACVIPDPMQYLEQLIADVDGINYAQGIDNALDAKLDAIYAALTDVNENNDAGACNALDAFVIYVEAQWAVGRLTDRQAGYLIDFADEIIALLCPK